MQLDPLPLRLPLGLGADPEEGRACQSSSSPGNGAIGHPKADTLLTVSLELLASSEKVTRVALIQVLVATL